MIGKYLNDESGATAIEYGLICALVAVACITAMTSLGTALASMFDTIKIKLDTAKTP